MKKRRFQIVLLAVLILASTCVAETVKILNVAYDAETAPNEITVLLEQSLNHAPAREDCGVLNLTHEILLRVSACELKGPNFNLVVIHLEPPVHVDTDSAYFVFFRNLDLKPSGHVDLAQSSINQIDAPPTNTSLNWTCMFSRFQQLAKFELDAAGDRDGSDFYFAGQVTHSRDGNFVGTYDTKIDLSGACNFFLHRVSLIGPTLDLTGGNDPNGDPDSLNFSFKWELPLTGQGYPHKLGTVRLINKATLESTQDFAQRDFIYDGDIRGVLRPWFLSADGKVRAHFYPDFGIEMGKNLRGILPAIDGNNIVRPKIGASFFFIFDAAKVGLKDISLDTSYARRWPLIDEVTFKKDDNGGFTGIDVGTHPRDHVKQSMNIDITKYLGFVISYEYGSEPPKYKFLDSKFTLGLNIKAAFK